MKAGPSRTVPRLTPAHARSANVVEAPSSRSFLSTYARHPIGRRCATLCRDDVCASSGETSRPACVMRFHKPTALFMQYDQNVSSRPECERSARTIRERKRQTCSHSVWLGVYGAPAEWMMPRLVYHAFASFDAYSAAPSVRTSRSS